MLFDLQIFESFLLTQEMVPTLAKILKFDQEYPNKEEEEEKKNK